MDNKKCKKAQSAMLLYEEKQIKPLQSLALFWHIKKCKMCRESFLVFDEVFEEAFEYQTPDLTDGFTDLVMDKICALPAHTQESYSNWLRYIGSLYALLLAFGFVMMYNAEWAVPVVLTEHISLVYAGIYSGISQAGQIGMGLLAQVGNYILVVGVFTSAALVYMVKYEKNA